jgi:hypothetical protein
MVMSISQYPFHQRCCVSGNPEPRHLEDPVHLRSPSSFRAIILVLTDLVLLKTMGEVETVRNLALNSV